MIRGRFDSFGWRLGLAGTLLVVAGTVTAADSQCVTCHSGSKATDLVFSKLRE